MAISGRFGVIFSSFLPVADGKLDGCFLAATSMEKWPLWICKIHWGNRFLDNTALPDAAIFM